MIKSSKIRIYPNKSQISLIHGTLGCCNWIKNKYLEMNIDRYKNDKSFVSSYEFSKYINHLKKTDPEYYWIKKYSSKAIRYAMLEKENAYKRFFKKNSGFPRFRSRKFINKESFYFIKDNIHYISNNIIKLPILGEIKITENEYLPDINDIISGRVVREFDRFYISLIYNTNSNIQPTTDEEFGIDAGIKNYITVASNKRDSLYISHFKDNEKYKEYEDRIKRLQQIISNKVEINYARLINNYMDKHPDKDITEDTKKILKGGSYNTSRIRYIRKKIRSLKRRQANIRQDFINKLVNMLTARTKPRQITIENLDISEMIKHDGTEDSSLHRYIQESSFYTFKMKLINKCTEYGVILRIADKYFASSKECSCCGHKKDSLTLNDRIYICDKCGLEIDRDLNAAINLLKLKNKKCLVYKFA